MPRYPQPCSAALAVPILAKQSWPHGHSWLWGNFWCWWWPHGCSQQRCRKKEGQWALPGGDPSCPPWAGLCRLPRKGPVQQQSPARPRGPCGTGPHPVQRLEARELLTLLPVLKSHRGVSSSFKWFNQVSIFKTSQLIGSTGSPQGTTSAGHGLPPSYKPNLR